MSEVPAVMPETRLRAVDLDDRHSVLHFDDGVPGALWVRGRTYKASVDADGFEYVPFFGSGAPRNFPVRFTLTGVERGKNALELPAAGQVSRDGSRFTLRRGSIDVRYDVALDSVEQSVALDVPAGSGDLVLRFDVESELECVTDGPGFRFVGEHGAVGYGAATALGAQGAQSPVPALWVDGALELRVPAGFLAEAGSRIVVDPVVQTFAIDTYFENLLEADAAYDVDSDAYLCVYEEAFSSEDTDIYSSRIDAGTGNTAAVGYFDLSGDNHVLPAVAFQRFQAKFLVVTQADDGGDSRIVGRIRDIGSGSFEPPVDLALPGAGFRCVAPDVGGDTFNGSASFFCVAYGRDFGTDTDLAYMMVTSAGVQTGATTTIAGFVSRDEHDVQVSASAGDPNAPWARFNIAWATEDLNGGTHWMSACQVAFDGTVVTAPHAFTAPQPDPITHVDVSSSSTLLDPLSGEVYYVVGWNLDGSGEGDLYYALRAGDTTVATGELNQSEHVDWTADSAGLRTVCTGEKFLCSYADADGVWLTSLDPMPNGLAVDERRTSLPATIAGPIGVHAASEFDGGALTGGEAFVAWSEWDLVDWNVLGALYAPAPLPPVAMDVRSVGVQYCYNEPYSNGVRGFIALRGERVAGTPHVLVIEGVPQLHLGRLLVARTAGNVPLALGTTGTLCLGSDVSQSSYVVTVPGGRTRFEIDTSLLFHGGSWVGALPGETWFFQVWHRNGAADAALTNALAVQFN